MTFCQISEINKIIEQVLFKSAEVQSTRGGNWWSLVTMVVELPRSGTVLNGNE